jgi:hypothetical protein
MSANSTVTCRRSPDGLAGSDGVNDVSLTLEALVIQEKDIVGCHLSRIPHSDAIPTMSSWVQKETLNSIE